MQRVLTYVAVVVLILVIVVMPVMAFAVMPVAHANTNSHTTPTGIVVTRTPYMGVDTWYAYGTNIDQAIVVRLVNAVAADGLERAGYKYIWLDAGWWNGARNPDGSIAINPTQWPNGLAWLTSYIHSKGLRAGIYEESGVTACGNGGALDSAGVNHVQQDVNTLAGWGFDALKVDYCGDYSSLRSPPVVLANFSQAIQNDTPRRVMLLNWCDADTWNAYPYTSAAAWSYAPAYATSWRTGTDMGWPVGVSWANMLRNITADAAHPHAASDGHWNDPDYLTPMLWPNMAQAQAQMTMWAMLAAPLMVSADVTSMPYAYLHMVTNPRVLAIDQDRLGVQAHVAAQVGGVQVWVKPLATGSKAVALLNRSDHRQRVTVTPSMVGLHVTNVHVLHVWSGSITQTHALHVTVGPQSALLLQIS